MATPRNSAFISSLRCRLSKASWKMPLRRSPKTRKRLRSSAGTLHSTLRESTDLVSCYNQAMRLQNMSTTELFELLVGGGILVILLIALVAIIFRRRTPPGDGGA